jgi:hypothetical protein
VKDLFTVSGNGHLYAECMIQMAEARKAKQRELAARIATKKRLRKDLAQIGVIVLICLLVVPLALGLLIYRIM